MKQTHNVAWPLTVYYDAACPICRTEIEALKARDGGDLLRLVDCSAPEFGEGPGVAAGITRAAMMARIHACDAAGRWVKGIDVFAAVYHAAGLRFIARLYASRRLRPLLDRVYPWIADNRYRLSRWGLPRLFHALVGAQATPFERDCASRSCARRPPT